MELVRPHRGALVRRLTIDPAGRGRVPPSAPRHRLQALEGQALGVLYAGQIEPADKGRDCIAVTVGQRNHGIDGNSLGVHGLPHVPAASIC
jgi:hypothetical protein